MSGGAVADISDTLCVISVSGKSRARAGVSAVHPGTAPTVLMLVLMLVEGVAVVSQLCMQLDLIS